MINNKELDKEFDETFNVKKTLDTLRFGKKTNQIMDWIISWCSVRDKEIKTFIHEKLRDQKETLCLEYDKQYLKREEKLIEKIDKKHFFELEEVRMKEGQIRRNQHNIYDKKLKETQDKYKKKLIKEIEKEIKEESNLEILTGLSVALGIIK